MKEQPEQMEGERLLSELDRMNVALMEKEERICRLEKELHDARGAVRQVQSRCREAEKEKERGVSERANMQADLQDAQSNFQNLERECKVKQDVVEKQRRALESLADKVEQQKESFQSQLEDARRKLIESEEREQKFEIASQHMAEKDRQLKSLRDAHEKLLAVQKGKQAEERHEIREVFLELEASNSKCEEQKALIKEQEQELGRIKKEAHQLNARVAAAETDAISKASMLEKVQLELKNTSSHAVSLEKANAQIEDLKVQVETLMNKLSDESALRCKAECALHEYKVREDSLLKIEQDGKALQEECKWRNEQFESLEEAHNRMTDQLHEGRSMWASEKAAILKDVEVLTENVQSRDMANHDLRSQVKLLEQSLAHEENCRKLLEFQLADAKAGMESVSAEYLAAQSILESLRENSKKELAFLKDTLAEKDRQLKELHLKQAQIVRDQKELMELEAELGRYKSSCEQLQQTLEKGAEQQGLKAMEIQIKSEWQDERENLMRSLTDAEATTAAKKVEMKEFEMELDRTRTLSELLRTALSEAEEKRLEAKSEAISTLEQVSASLSAKEQHAMELETELERLQVVVNDVRECNAEAERTITVLEDRLRDAQVELQAKNKLSNSLLNVQVHEEVVLAMRSECEALQRQVNTYDLEKFEIEKHRDKLLTEMNEKKQLHHREKENLVDGRKDRSAMSAGQRTLARRQVEDLAKQVKLLNAELQKWQDVAAKSDEGSTKLQSALESVQKEREDLKSELNEWMQKSLELNCVIKDLEADLENWKQSAARRNDENQLQIEELKHLRAEVERWKNVAETAEEEGKTAKMDLLDTRGKFEDELKVMSSNSNGGCSTAEGRSLKEEELDCSWQTSGRISNDSRHVASETDIEDWKLGSLEVEDWKLGSLEVEDWKTKVACAEKEQEDLRQNYETTVKELRLEVEAWKKSAESIAEDGKLERVELEKKLKDIEAKAREVTDHLADECKRSSLELAEVQAELQIWKKRAADAAEECTSLRDAHDNVIKELQLELAQWKEKLETATEEGQSMRADLEKAVQDLQNQVYFWKQKAEKALEGVVKNQDLITALKEELGLSMQRTQESKALQLQLENEQVHLKESLTATQKELQKWKDKVAVVTKSIRSLQDESTLVIEEGDEVNVDSLNAFESQLQKWKSKAELGELLQLQRKDLLAETQTELNEWKQKAADFSLAADSLKKGLESVMEEGRIEKEELLRSTGELEAELRLWRERAQDSQSHLESSKTALQKWEEKAAAITQSTRSLMEEFDFTIEGQLEKQEIYASISALKPSVLVLKEKVAEGESMQLQLKSTLLETQTELQDWKDRADSNSVAMNSLKGEIDSILEGNRQQKKELCNTINELDAELLDWKSRAQEGVSVQIQLERALSEKEEKAAAAATDMQALKEELDRTIAESCFEIHQLCSSNAALKAELLELKEKAENSHSPQLLQLQNVLTETQSQLQEWQEKATVASQAEDELRSAIEEIRSEAEKLHNFIRALKDELLEWKEKAEYHEMLQAQLTSSLTSSSEELQSWKQKALTAETEADLDLKNSVSNLATELSLWKEKAQDGEFLHQQMKKSLTDTQTEIQDLKEKIAAFSSSTDSLKDDLNRANELASSLRTQLNTQKQNEASLQKLNCQLESDLVLVREEAFSRKQKMTQILTQLEGTSNGQRKLQKKLHLAQHQLLENEKHRSQAESVNLRMGEKAAAKDIDDVVSCNSSPENDTSHHQRENEELYAHGSLWSPKAHRYFAEASQEFKAMQERAQPQRMCTSRTEPQSFDRFKVDGNLPRAAANHDKLHVEALFLPVAPEYISCSWSSRTAGGL